MRTLIRSVFLWIIPFALAACPFRNTNHKPQAGTSTVSGKDSSLAVTDTQHTPLQTIPDDSAYCKIYCWCMQKIKMQDDQNELHSFCETIATASPASIAREENLHIKIYSASRVASLHKLLFSTASSAPYPGNRFPDSRLVIVLKRENLMADTFVYLSRDRMFVAPGKMLQYDFNIGDALEKATGRSLQCE